MIEQGARGVEASIWDRLCASNESSIPSGYRTSARQESKESLRRDLELLLNTRRPLFASTGSGVVGHGRDTELHCSLVWYGVPDFTGAHMDSPEQREKFRRELERTVVKFEPRLTGVRVEEISPASEIHDRLLRYLIRGIVRSDAKSRYGDEEARFETHIQPITRSCTVRRIQ